jgi:hypothetical protein
MARGDPSQHAELSARSITRKLRYYSLARRVISKDFKKLLKKAKKANKKAERERLIESFLCNPEIFWRQVTSRRGARVAIDIDSETLFETYKTNFSVIEQTDESEHLERKMKSVIDKYTNLLLKKKSKFKVDPKKIYDILRGLKNKKAAGLNGLTNELFKYGRDTILTKVIANLFESIIRGGFFPKNLNVGLICTIVKDPSQSNQSMDNTRPITLSEVLSIVLENFVLEQLLKDGTLHRHQFGFRKNSSCMHAVYSIKEVMEDVREKKSNAYAVYLDFSKAFDKVNRTKLLHFLMESINPNIWLLIKHYYENLMLHVITSDGKITPSFKATVGVKQGGSMSPWLFNKYIDRLIAMLEETGKTYSIAGVSVGVMVYADDTNVICHTVNDLYKCIIVIERYCMLYDIKINAKKTKWMLFGSPKSILSENVCVNGEKLEKVNSFKFLGVTICQDGSYNEHIEKRKSLFLNGLGEVRRLGFDKKDVPIKMKKLLYTSLVRSKLTYGLETIEMKDSVLKKTLGKLEGNCLKSACGINYRSRTTTLVCAMGITPIGLYAYKRKIFFILELLKNQATNELISIGIHSTLRDTIESLGLTEGDRRLGPGHYRVALGNACLEKINEIKLTEKKIRETSVVTAVEYLLSHRNLDNDDTLQYLLDPRRGRRG